MTQTSQATPVTPVSAAYNFTQSYNGMMGLNIGLAGEPERHYLYVWQRLGAAQLLAGTSQHARNGKSQRLL